MKYLKTYQLFESQSGLTPEQEEFLNEYTYYGTWTYNPATGLVDVKGDFDCSYEKLKDLKGVRFGKVNGRFYCRNNELTSLAGGPQKVGVDFRCQYNKLTSLKGAPQELGGDFICEDNNLTSLKGAPQEVGGIFSCNNNQLTTLAGAPQEVGGYFNCAFNKLTSLAGGPQEVGGYFKCYYNKLTSLEGAPQEVGEGFDCSDNELTSLEGVPQYVGGYFSCDAFDLGGGEWNLKGWLRVLKEGTPEAQKLIPTIFSAEELNKEIQKDPAGMIMKLKDIWNDDGFKETRSKLVWPKGYGDQAKLVGDLDDVGF